MARGIRSQITLEYIITVLLMFSFFMFMMVYFSDQFGSYNKEALDKGLKEYTDSLKIELDTAETMGEGYSREIRLPQRIMGAEYDINIRSMQYNSELVLKARGQEYVVIVAKTAGNFTKGSNTISRYGGIIRITQ